MLDSTPSECLPFLVCSSAKSLAFCKGHGQWKDYENLVQQYLEDLCLSVIWRLAFAFVLSSFLSVCVQDSFLESRYCALSHYVKPCKPTSASKCSWCTMEFSAICFFSLCAILSIPLSRESSEDVSPITHSDFPLSCQFSGGYLFELLYDRVFIHYNLDNLIWWSLKMFLPKKEITTQSLVQQHEQWELNNP